MSRDRRTVHEFWRMQLLDDLHRKIAALEYDPGLDPDGRRRDALLDLIARFEEIEADELRDRGGS